MDLVDIDKVLDDLELNEESDIPGIASGGNTYQENSTRSSSKELSHQMKVNKHLKEINETGTTESGYSENRNISDDIVENREEQMNKNFSKSQLKVENSKERGNKQQQQRQQSHRLNDTSQLSTARSKKFVAVSHVFSSLDEYCRDIEGLQGDLEQIQLQNKKSIEADEDSEFKMLLSSTIDQQNNISAGSSSSLVASNQHLQLTNNDKNLHQSNILNSPRSDIADVAKALPSISPVAGQQQQQQQQQQHTEEEHREDFQEEGETTSPSSITTSSPSSFSSGPSPRSGGESTNEEEESGSLISSSLEEYKNQQQQQKQKREERPPVNAAEHQRKSKKNREHKTKKISHEEMKISENHQEEEKNSKKIYKTLNDIKADHENINKMEQKEDGKQPSLNEITDLTNSNAPATAPAAIVEQSSPVSSCLGNEVVNTLSSLPWPSQTDNVKMDTFTSLSSLPQQQSTETISRINDNSIETPKTTDNTESGDDKICITTSINSEDYRDDDENDDLDDDEDNEHDEPISNQSDPDQKSDELQNNNNKQNQNENKQFCQVVGFGSTMDEISDAELDSILQEIDSDLQSSYPIVTQPTIISTVAAAATNLDPRGNSSSQNKDKSIAAVKGITTTATAEAAPIATSCSTSVITFSTSTIVSTGAVCCSSTSVSSEYRLNPTAETPKGKGHEEKQERRETEISSHKEKNFQCENNSSKLMKDLSIEKEDEEQDINLQNADSLSQASTIEFAELRLQTDFGGDSSLISPVYDKNSNDVAANEGGSSNGNQLASNVVSDSTVNNSSNNNNNNYNINNNNNNDSNKDELEKKGTDDGGLTSRVKVEDEFLSATTTSDAPDLATEAKGKKSQLQRPNSLDLPQITTSNKRGNMITINSTAGQTPPASRIEDSVMISSSSSEDISQQLPSASSETTTAAAANVADDTESVPKENASSSATVKTNDCSPGNESGKKMDDELKNITEASTVATDAAAPTTKLGKIPPIWIPDSEAQSCMQCNLKFSLIKRRHHCRACGQVLCSSCCSQKAKLEFLGNNEVRVCVPCYSILSTLLTTTTSSSVSSSSNSNHNQIDLRQHGISSAGLAGGTGLTTSSGSGSGGTTSIISGGGGGRPPNPNNPMEYCSVIPPHQQVSQMIASPISVMVPVGVLKREGSSKANRKDKNVIFSDGIRPGCDLTELDNWDENKPYNNSSNNNNNNGTSESGSSSRVNDNTNGLNNINNNGNDTISGNNRTTDSGPNNNSNLNYKKLYNKRRQVAAAAAGTSSNMTTTSRSSSRNIKNLPNCDENFSYIPKQQNDLPPIYITNKGESEYKEVENNAKLIERLQTETLKFAVQRNFYVFVKIAELKCCINKTIINFATQGMHHVGQDEIIILLELDNSGLIPKDIFIHLNEIYNDAERGHPISELGFSMPTISNFLGSKDHGGFLYIRVTYQCLQEIHLPESPFLIGVLIHRWEVPWAKIFPLRLMLRLGAQYRYYPSPHISIRGRESVYAEIAQTIINFLADFRNYTYTLPVIKGMYIYMEDRKTSVLIPKNRYDQVMKALNNSSDHILPFAGNFSTKADGHLVCIQNMNSNCPETHTYSTQAINIQGKPQRVTGASFIVLNGSLKSTSGLSGKCTIVEDGLMVQILPTKMASIRTALKNMKDIEIICGPVNADESQTELVTIKWIENDTEFNIGVKSPIEGKIMDGIPSIRVYSGLNFSNHNHSIRWTEVFIIQIDEEESGHHHEKDPIEISKISEQLAKATSAALLPFLDLLAASSFRKIGLRATLHQENVSYEAGSQSIKLAPIYMNALDNKLIPILHKYATANESETPIILELIFHILDI